MKEKIKVIFKCECGKQLGAYFYDDEPNDVSSCGCGNVYRITRPEINREEVSE